MFYIKPQIAVESLTISAIKNFSPGKRIVLLSSKTVFKNHGLNQIVELLKMESEVHVYTHVRPDAPFEDLDDILDDIGNKTPDSIIAVGGGSVIDAAKALSISFGRINYKNVFYGRANTPIDKVKLLAVPSTAGTGAELSFGAILYDKKNGKKGGVRGEIVQPDYVIIDAKIHNSAPFKLKAEVGFDCLTHAIETYISRKSSPIVKMQSVSCIKILFAHLLPACKENTLRDMEKVAIASTLMGINLAFSSTCLPHRIQYVIGPMTGTSHAQGLIALYKGWLKHLHKEKTIELSELALDLGMTVPTLLKRVQQLKIDLDIAYNLQDLGISEKDIDIIANGVSGNVQADPSYQDLDSIKNILKFAY